MGWFTFDLIITFCDWAVLVVQKLTYISAIRATKAVRLLRLMRLMRAAKVLKVPDTWIGNKGSTDRFHSESFMLLVGIVKIAALFVGIVHAIARLFYGVTTMFNEPDMESWTEP